jgi:hypothetical protein
MKGKGASKRAIGISAPAVQAPLDALGVVSRIAARVPLRESTEGY